ncbi:hypothetical protein NDI76_14165 [Halogeometricum sp. S1BR25-6]|uniref:Uncharacterized protein n=1 Tax=Halogeometricum salsisoli TaxID=2950536 RepID=A0ABU2GGF6_9EURY|nr:hypothetical protein [Halogeometricum sp. S1BR25-6]MDS0299890.1 hypothetical protein [Halogeometricum sp. S1BR25-6]
MLTDVLSSPFAAAHLLMLALLGYWASLDADARGSDAAPLWALGSVVVQPLVFGYLLYRSEIGGRPVPTLGGPVRHPVALG